MECHRPTAGRPYTHLIGCSAIRFGSNPCSASATQKPDPLSDDFGHISFVTVFVIVTAGSDTAFDKDLPTFGQVLPARFTLLSPDNNVMPFGSLLPIAIRVRPHFRCRNRKARHGTSSGGETYLRIFSQIADQDCFVYRHQSLPPVPKPSLDGNSKITLSPL